MLALLYIIIIVAWVVLMMVLKCRMPKKCSSNSQEQTIPYSVQSVHVIQIDPRTQRDRQENGTHNVWAHDNHGFHGEENTANIFPSSNIIFSSELPPTYEEAIRLPRYIHKTSVTNANDKNGTSDNTIETVTR